MLSNEASYRDQIQKLETELSVYKRAYTDVDAERRQLEKLKHDAEKEKVLLENQLKVARYIHSEHLQNPTLIIRVIVSLHCLMETA